ncbi:MAG: LppP/LprE family lipoprotein [Leptolyngbyaceae cyanobacterium SM2_5_2]|nr:LppP/LprE family lipoprotein [Leptolyngbyaceae cyanobacterium SM2_5_2]
MSGSLALASLVLAHSSLAQVEPSGVWLDEAANWNQVGASIPQAPAFEATNLADCQHTVRPAVLPEDEQVEAAGWTLTDSAQIYGDTVLITGMANADGMCRPFAYQVFVFTDGDFSGTLSPIPMNSREDGSLFDLDLYRDGFISAAFNRYQPEDAQCCASRESRLFYEVDVSTNPPVLVPQWPASTVDRPQ